MKRVLIAEDNPDTRELMSMALRDAGFQVEFAHTGLETGSLCRAAVKDLFPFDLLILDVAMPLHSGREVLRELRAEGIETKAIFLTGFAPGEIAEDARDLQAKIWQKPEALVDFKQRIEAEL